MKTIQYLFISTMLFLPLIGCAQIATEEVAPVGVYAEIDIEKENKIFERLGNEATVAEAINEVIANPNDYNPTVLYVISALLFESGKKRKPYFGFTLLNCELDMILKGVLMKRVMQQQQLCASSLVML